MEHYNTSDKGNSPQEAYDPSSALNKRKRLAHACDSCRAKKKRCNGGHPCSSCNMDHLECTYGFATTPQGKSDTILKMVIHNTELVQKVLDEMQHHRWTDRSPSTKVSDIASPSFTISSHRREHHDAITNATIPSRHTSGANFMLQWPIFDDCPTLRNDILTIYNLESSRPTVGFQPLIRFPYAAPDEVDRIIYYFQHNINFWMPTMSLNRIAQVRETILSGQSDLTCEFCLAMLVMALGWACEFAEQRLCHGSIGEQSLKHSQHMSSLYFDAAARASPLAQIEITPVTAHCSLLMVLYLTYLQRPIQAWVALDSTALKCRLILDHLSDTMPAEDEESVRRIFWSCYLLESDMLVELSGVPESRVGIVESSIPPLQSLATHTSDEMSSEALEYFLACISIRRLLNRSHHLLYSQANPVYNSYTPTLILELNSQLYSWWECLPPNLKFDIEVDDDGLYHGGLDDQNDYQVYLRGRLMACQCVILRPYLMDATYGTDVIPRQSSFTKIYRLPTERQRQFKKALKACLILASTTRELLQTVTISAWISSCSAISTMLTFLASERILGHSLEQLHDEIVDAGQKLVSFASLLRDFHKDCQPNLYTLSPSMSQNSRLIENVQCLLVENVLLPPLSSISRTETEGKDGFRFLIKHDNDFSVRIEKLKIPRIKEQLLNELKQAEAGIAGMTDPDPDSVNIIRYEDIYRIMGA